MSKKSITLVSILVLLLGGYFIVKEFSLPRFVSSKLSSMMKVYVSLGELDLGFKNIEAESLTIMNPKGFHLKKAMSIENIAVSAPFQAFFKDEVIIEELDLSNIYVGLEYENQSSKKGNWTVIMSNLESAAPKTVKDSAKHVYIKKCILTNLQVELAYTSGNPAPKYYPTIKRLEIYDIDSRNGLPMQEISKAILDATLKQIFSQEGIKSMLENYLLGPSQTPFNLPFFK